MKFLSQDVYNADREIQTLKRVSPHPNIISLFGVFRANKQLVLAFPELDCSLRDYLGRRGGVASSSVSLRVANDLLSAAAHLHNMFVVHRDIKPANILIDFGCSSCPNAELTVKLADFSRARVLPLVGAVDTAVREEDPTALQANMSVGVATPMYSAPEVLLAAWTDRSMYGTAADVWSVAAVCFEVMVAHEFAYGESRALQIAAIICRLGPCPEDLRLGERQCILLKAAHLEVKPYQQHFPALENCEWSEPFWRELLAGGLKWDPKSRLIAVELKRCLEQHQASNVLE